MTRTHKRNDWLIILAGALIGLFFGVARLHAQYVGTVTPADLTSPVGTVTTSTSAITTSTLGTYDMAITLYADIDVGALEGVYIAPAAAASGNPAAASYFVNHDAGTTVTQTCKRVLRWDRETLRTARYWGAAVQGLGSDNSGATVTISYKRDQARP